MDGGMKNNFPSDVMIQNFNPDVLIGSKVAFNSNTPDPDDMFSQLENIFTEYTDFSLPDTALLIEPKVRNYGASDFELIDTLIELGYAAALKKINVIKKAIPREQKPSDLQTKRDEFRKRLPPLVFNNVIISGLNSKQKQYVKRNIKANRDTFSFAELQKEYFLLLSDNKIREIEPTTTFNPQTGFFDLFLDVKTDYQIQVQLGGQINSTSKNFSFLGVSYKHLGKRAYDVTGSLYYGRMYSSMRLVGSVDFPYFRNRKGKRLFPLFANLAINYSRRDYFNSTKEWFFEDETPSYITQRENYVRFNVGIPFSTNGFFALGSTYGATADHYYQANVVSREDKEDITRFDYFSPSATVEYSTLNEKQFSTQGKYAKLMVRQVFGREEFLPGTTAGEVGLIKANESHAYQEVELQVKNYHYITDKLKIEGAFQAFYSNKKLFSNYLITKLSSDEYIPFPHTILFYLPNFRTHSYFSVGATPLYKFTDRISLRAGAYFYQPYRQIEFNLYKAQLGEPFKEYYIIGNASMVYQTFMGPLYASVSYFDRANNQWFFHFGFGFLILNPRGLD
jgi:NTE family protein